MFDAIEPLLLDGDNEPAVDEQRGGGIVIHCINSKNVHWPTLRSCVFFRPSIHVRAAAIAMSALFTTAILAVTLVLRSTSSWDPVAEYRTCRDQSGGFEAILR